MDGRMKEMMKRLGEAINESLQDAEKVQSILREMEEKGYTLTLSLGVIVGPKGQQQEIPRRRPRPSPAEEGKGLEAQPTPFDRKFLKALRIRIAEEKK
jgi:hypothetical protein